jgi:hypothetical protein
MKYSVPYRSSLPPSACPYRLLDPHGQEVDWANSFLDAQNLRRLSPRSLRSYAFDLLHFARWSQHPLAELTQSRLLDYVRFQLDQQPQPTPQTMNHRLTVLHCLYRFHHGQEIPSGSSYLALFTRLRPALPRPGLAIAFAAAPVRHHSTHSPTGRTVLGHLPHPRSFSEKRVSRCSQTVTFGRTYARAILTVLGFSRQSIPRCRRAPGNDLRSRAHENHAQNTWRLSRNCRTGGSSRKWRRRIIQSTAGRPALS